MKIAIIGTLASSALLFRIDLIKELISENHEVFVLCTDFNDENRRLIRNIGAQPIDYHFEKGGVNPFKDIRDTWRLSKILKKINPDIAFSYFVKPVIFGTIAAAIAGVKKRISMLEGLGYAFTDFPDGQKRKQKILCLMQIFLYGISFRFLHHLIFLNPDDPIDLIYKNNLRVRKVSVLGGIGVNLDEYSYRPVSVNDSLSFIFVARLLAEKGVYEYVMAAKRIKSICPNIRFIMLGGIDRESFNSLSSSELKNLVSEGVIEYPGHVDNVRDWMIESSVFVLPSYYREGVPRSTQEAMAIGRAVITTDVPGCRETVIDGLNGYLIPRWDVDALVERMLLFIKKPELVRSMGDESYRIAQDRFDARKVNKRLVRLINSET